MLTLAPLSHGSRRRRGVALVMFIVLAFAFFAIAGIAIDVGLASLTQQEMQVAVDPAAMEGVRLRNYNVYPHYSDMYRRPKVSNYVRKVFDDDLHPTGGTASETAVASGMPPDDPDALHLGAGPLLRVDNPGAGELAPGGVLATGLPAEFHSAAAPTPTWDDPTLQGNQFPWPDLGVGNFEVGDMVSGTYVDGQPHTESYHYHRTDFVRADPSAVPGGANWSALGFLVRMRRTPGTNPDDSSFPKSTRGPTVPFIWSRGSLMRKDDAEDWDPRRDGMTVRATAISVARPALRASAPPRLSSGQIAPSESETHAPMFGLQNLCLSLDFWAQQNPGTTWLPAQSTLTVDTTGALTLSSQVVGYLTESAHASSIGLAVQPDPLAVVPTSTQPGYVAIYAHIPDAGAGVDRIVGYGFCEVRRGSTGLVVQPGIRSDGHGSSTDSVRIWVGANGVSANIGPETPALSGPEWDEVFRQNRILAYGGDNNAPDHDVNYDYQRIRPGTLLAPALAR